MAYKQGNPLVKLVILAVVVFAGYKFGLPWAKEKGLLPSERSATTRASETADCLGLAEEAGNLWADGISRFINPPVDASAWSGFRSEVDDAISAARVGCGGSEDSCHAARDAMSELSRLVNDMDAAVRSGGPPTVDVVRAQERVDTLLDRARALTKEGK